MTEQWPGLGDLAEIAVTPADESRYRYLSSSYMAVGTPELVLMARDERDVSAAVGYASRVRRLAGWVPFSVRSGGHGISGSSTNRGGIVLDLSGLNQVEVLDPEVGLVQVGAGAVWGEVAAELAPYGLVMTSGNAGDTGVGGLGTAGGIGYLVRERGLTIDSVVRATLVTADGVVHEVDAENEPDLFWAVRGGVTHAGIVTRLWVIAHQVGEDVAVIHQMSQHLVDDLPTYVAAWGDLIREAPRRFTSFLMIQAVQDGRHIVVARNVWADADIPAAEPTITAFAELAPLLQHDAMVMPYPRVVPTPRSPKVGQQRIQMRAGLADRADFALGAAFLETLGQQATALVELRSLGGAVGDLDPQATAWAHRHQEALVAIWAHPRGEAAIDEAWGPIGDLVTGTYGAYSSDTRPAQAELAWPGETGRRLRELAERHDPEHLFDAGLTLRRSPRPGADG